MEDIKTVQKYLDQIFESVKVDLEQDRFVRSLIGTEEDVDYIIERQKQLISEYIEDWQSQAKDFSKRFEELYTELDTPYTVIAWFLDRIKCKVIEKLIEENYSQEFLIKMKAYLDRLVNQIAKIYLKKDCNVLRNFESSPFADRLLYKVHSDWFQRIADCIENDDFSNFPLISVQECELTKVLTFPESLFVCLDANMCTYVHNLHTLIHDTANSFYSFYMRGEYYQAYRVFKDLTELVAKFLKTISELYFLAYSDQEGNFLRLAHLLSAEKNFKYVSIIDILGLGNINRVYGKEAGDKVLEEAHKRLKALVSDDRERTLLVRGVTTNFLMINMGYDEEEIKELASKVAKELSFELNLGDRRISVSAIVATLELEPYVELTPSELMDILFYLKEEAKKEISHTSISVGKESREKIIAWINEKYRNIDKVKNLIESGRIDVVFHPIANSSETHKVEGVEVLARLEEDGKLVPAGLFIDLIYELDLVERLDRLVLKKLLEYKDLLREVPSLFVNVSPRSISSDRYLSELENFLNEMKSSKIVLELTEQHILENIDNIKKVSLSENVGIAVDDFGVGYSSLKLVADLAEEGILKVLKIDGSLVQKLMESHSVWKVVDAISVLSKRLDLLTVGEFVESEGDIKVLKSLGVDCVQGYYIAKPMRVYELVAWLKNEKLK